MCCFSRMVEHVSATRIFARPLADGGQYLAYAMNFEASGELAMILPLPVPPSAPEDAVQFVSLADYPDLFADLARAFPMDTMMPERAKGGGGPLARSAPRLVVHDVGEFDASFVPALADFDRLDERFTLSPAVWEQLPRYRDWGFAVFKLKPRRKRWWQRLLGRGAVQTVHPMAFRFPRRDPGAVFFPTVHVHDGQVHEQAMFDHQLYVQPDARPRAPSSTRSRATWAPR